MWVLTPARSALPLSVCVCVCGPGEHNNPVLNICIGILKRELNFRKGIAEIISYPPLGRSKGWRVLFLSNPAFQSCLFFNPDSAMLVGKRRKYKCCSENLASQRYILWTLSHICHAHLNYKTLFKKKFFCSYSFIHTYIEKQKSKDYFSA